MIVLAYILFTEMILAFISCLNYKFIDDQDIEINMLFDYT